MTSSEPGPSQGPFPWSAKVDEVTGKAVDKGMDMLDRWEAKQGDDPSLAYRATVAGMKAVDAAEDKLEDALQPLSDRADAAIDKAFDVADKAIDPLLNRFADSKIGRKLLTRFFDWAEKQGEGEL